MENSLTAGSAAVAAPTVAAAADAAAAVAAAADAAADATAPPDARAQTRFKVLGAISFSHFLNDM
ncbi:MAG: MFS transporter, partial [Gammaproteobacteria bacterium]